MSASGLSTESGSLTPTAVPRTSRRPS